MFTFLDYYVSATLAEFPLGQTDSKGGPVRIQSYFQIVSSAGILLFLFLPTLSTIPLLSPKMTESETMIPVEMLTIITSFKN